MAAAVEIPSLLPEAPWLRPSREGKSKVAIQWAMTGQPISPPIPLGENPIKIISKSE